MENVKFSRFLQVAKVGEEMEYAVDTIRGEDFNEGRMEAAVAFEEAFMNIVMHAYPSSEGPMAFTVEIKNTGTIVEIEAVFDDCGIPYDPTKAKISEMTDEFQVGGHGIRLMRSYVEMSYARIFDHNLLRIRKTVHI